jgi:nickel-dependent lactate racemase
MIKAIATPKNILSPETILRTLNGGLKGRFSGQRVLVLTPDHTRSLPLPQLFRMLVDVLQETRQLDFMVALGTHPPLSNENLCKLVGITTAERTSTYNQVGLSNHTWDNPATLETMGIITRDEVRHIAGKYWHPSLGADVPVRINKAALNYDHILILGPTFPHEVVGFSGGAKCLFPGISGPEMIHTTHWLGALAGVLGTIGNIDTPVRTMIHLAASKINTPITLVALIVEGYDLSGILIGDYVPTWYAAAELSSQRHIRWCEHAFQQVLSCPPPMYDELWTASKAMYKLEPTVAPGGEVIIYAPHLDTVSRAHEKYIYEAGYHVLPYFLANWEYYKHIPLGILAHCTHLRGSGVFENGVEKPNVRVTLASKISPQECERLNLGYRDPATIEITKYKNRESEGILYVPKAGEILYRLRIP